jgi:chloramphenicol-sensitive protein RarD
MTLNKGVLYSVGAYIIWGILPVYWKAVQEVPSPEIVSHRVIWSFIFVIFIIWIRRDWGQLKSVLKNRKAILTFLLSAGLISVNWLTYIWGVNAGFIVETSLGYFINPLVSVVIGVIVFREKLRHTQWLAVGIASIGVLYLTFMYGELPWIALTLAVTFGLYGMIKKATPVAALNGVVLETGFMFSPALFYLISLEVSGNASFGFHNRITSLLLILTGFFTAFPLLLYAGAAHRIHLSTLGILQFIAPTLQFFIGVFIYNESFTQERLIGFSLIWIALFVYSIDGIRQQQRSAQIA